MKKFIAIALLLAMCLGLFAGCAGNGGETTPSTDAPSASSKLEDAKDYLRAMYKDKAGKVLRSFDVVGVVTIDGTVYTVEWTTDVSEEYIKIVPADKLVTIEVVNAKPTEQIDFTLTATVKDAEGNTASTTLKYYIEAVEPEPVGTTFVSNPEVGVPYKFALTQVNVGSTIFFTGEMEGYYLATSDNAADGVDVVLEAADGGYYLSFTKDGAKKYIDIVPRDGAEGKVNVVLADEPTAVYTWDSARKTMTTTVEGNPWYLGCYKEYTTISASNTSYIEDVSVIGISQFPVGFATVGAVSTAPVEVANPVSGTAYKFHVAQVNVGKELYFTGEMEGYYLATSDNAADGVDVILEETDGGFYISFTKDGAKKYIDIVPRDGAEGKVNVVLADAPTAVYTWDAERKTMTTTVEGNPWYLGCYKEYETISASNTSYIEDVSVIGISQFPAGFATAGGSSDNSGTTEPAPTEPAPTEPAPTEPAPTEPAATEPAADTELSVKDAVALGASKEHNTYTEGKYYVTGVITEIYNTQYGNMKITDSEGNILTIYGTYSADGSTRFDAMASQPQVGDTIKVYGIIGQYSDAPQMKNGWIVEMPEHAAEPAPTEPAPTTPSASSEVKDGDKISIYNPGDGVYVTGTLYVYTSSSGSTKNELETTSNQSEALVLTVKISGDTVSFVTADGQYLYADGTNVQLVDAAGENTAFVLEAASGGYYIRCATATYNNNPQYLEIYKGYLTVYGLNTSNAGIYTFQLDKQ